jgi:hypothetical protein
MRKRKTRNAIPAEPMCTEKTCKMLTELGAEIPETSESLTGPYAPTCSLSQARRWIYETYGLHIVVGASIGDDDDDGTGKYYWYAQDMNDYGLTRCQAGCEEYWEDPDECLEEAIRGVCRIVAGIKVDEIV